MGGQSAGLIHATTRIIVSDIDRVGGCAKIPLPSTVTDNLKAALLKFLARSPFHSQPALVARVRLPWQRTGFEATWRRGNHAKSVGIDLSRLPLLDLSPTQHHTRHRCATLQNA